MHQKKQNPTNTLYKLTMEFPKSKTLGTAADFPLTEVLTFHDYCYGGFRPFSKLE